MKTYAYLTKATFEIVNGKSEKKIDTFKVEVMAVAGKYVMVRRKGCMPFVAETKNLSFVG